MSSMKLRFLRYVTQLEGHVDDCKIGKYNRTKADSEERKRSIKNAEMAVEDAKLSLERDRRTLTDMKAVEALFLRHTLAEINDWAL